MARNHLISLADIPDTDLYRLVDRGARFASGAWSDKTLDGAVVGVYFRATSTRTRTAFSSAALRLGARLITYGPHDLQVNTGETTADTGRVLAGMLDALVARTVGDVEELRALASQDRMAVVNAMAAQEHPTQALADLTAMAGHFGDLAGRRVLYMGEGNNTAAALALALPRYPGTELHLRTPKRYALDPEILVRAKNLAAQHGSTIIEQHDTVDMPRNADVVYTTRWQTTGTSKDSPDWREEFVPFRVDEAVMEAGPDAVFMHDLPAHRGDEVTAAVLDGPRSIAFTQAEAKMHSAAAVLEWSLGVLP
ncbi:ornithine carbamoyltransferase [Streptomyces californicus]|uniref:ornithine carbamoyltransferase n=1 Tax=Streptomyces TaxID=1883 RepID=UPI0006AFE34B|nr:ornithine carbamoyltransferase [Streptomyces sp. NRRL F-2295]KOU05479.1 ornithine carbamoyltransferase [Streptomyces sp. NRRL F-2295]